MWYQIFEKYDNAKYDDYLSYVIDVYDVGDFWQIISRGLNYLADIDEDLAKEWSDNNEKAKEWIN